MFQNFITTIYLTQVWYDRRLNIGWLGRQEPYLSIHFSDTEWIWRPDTFFKNELEALKHDNTRENLLLRILKYVCSPDGYSVISMVYCGLVLEPLKVFRKYFIDILFFQQWNCTVQQKVSSFWNW